MKNQPNLVSYGLSLLTATAALIGAGGPLQAQDKRPNILIIWGDDIGQFNLSAYNMGMMGYRTPNIDRLAKEGALFTDWYGQQSCTAGRAAFITGQSPIQTGLTKVGLPGANEGLRKEDPTLPELLKPYGYDCGQFGKNHLGDRNEFLPTVHGFAEFFGNLYHLNAEEEPENPDYPKDAAFKALFGPRGGCTALFRTRTIPRLTRASAESANRPSRIPVRCPRRAWKRWTMNSPLRRSSSWTRRTTMVSRSSSPAKESSAQNCNCSAVTHVRQ